MRVAIAGAHGQIARRLTRLLAARGDEVIGLIRNPEHAGDLRTDGATPVICDLEHDSADAVAEAIGGADAVVFAAGAGPGSGAARKLTMDLGGAVKLIDAAERAGVRRYVMISAVGAGSPPDGDDVMSVYLRAKADADRALAQSQLDWTILRPGGLTNDEGRRHARLDAEEFRGRVSRDDVAAVVRATLDEPRTVRLLLYVNAGEQPLEEALAAAVAG